jgi:hypothetical protein
LRLRPIADFDRECDDRSDCVSPVTIEAREDDVDRLPALAVID